VKRLLGGGAIVALVLTLIACSGQPTSVVPTTTAPATPAATTAAGTTGYPNATSLPTGYPGSPDSGTPGPTPSPLATPTTQPGTGSAKGVIQLKGKPVTDVEMYLAPLIKDSNGQESIVALDLATNPWGPTDSQGAFVIPNVAPGDYGLVLVTVTSQFHLLYPDKHQSVLVMIQAGQQVDLGTLNYPSLPIP
jgi:hypothetical protein